MNYTDNTMKTLPIFKKTLYTIGIFICLFLGIVGLILPIIPGLLFLFIAAVLLSKISRRVRHWLRGNKLFSKWNSYAHSVDSLSIPQKIKLTILFMAKQTLTAIGSGFSKIKQILQRK
ncbi:MAG: hypothetical protein COC19_04915 [SAR86 cluster bacterium]|uniref:DUF454 family protein n=1 Tax=SAR86 cluster bacterium TaxID=2030880 RepID=A0A2A4MN10_9GAMM|nr:MAG: hypothetical protein COC19_04915 [SAR86 cluster bacterium]